LGSDGADVDGGLLMKKGFQFKSWETRLAASRGKPKSRLEADAPLCAKCKTRMKVRTLLPGREFNDVDYRCEECGEKALRSVARGR
jgi:DNA-directed RNA polymerase subunit RPC12/RpoP